MLNNTVSSRSIKINVDTSAPVLNSMNVSTEKKGSSYVDFKLNITEKNFNNAVYYDNGDTKGKILCTSLNKNICSARIGFKVGSHKMNITVFDKAGNSVTRAANFTI